MNEFLKLVKERPNRKLWKKGVFCPYCNSKDVTISHTTTTLFGYTGKDMNHTHTYCHCNKCNKDFIRETCGFDNVWFTDHRGKVLLGIPYCFEDYIYTCKHCSGDVHRVWFDVATDKQIKPIIINGKEAGVLLSFEVKDGKSIGKQYPVFKCKNCGKEIRSENDYMLPS
jgi:hypothetical protein